MNEPDLVPTPAPALDVPRDPLVLAALKVMRPKQWTKNGLLAAALVQKGEGGSPDETLLKDGPILVTVGLYVLTAVGIMSAERFGWLLVRMTA